ncbi:MAG: PEP/pyruvate-binding domain-containing protein [Treponema sp.]|nr:PEP/pyruvate-binding domain-containing protein [Treponema sp.]
MAINNRASTGLSGLDKAIDMLRLGDNVVWQVQSVEDYLHVIKPYIKQAKNDGRRLVYFRFGSHAPLMAENEPSILYKMDASEGFESFATKIHNIIEQEGLKAFYVFDCLSDLLQFWYSDLMIGNFFRVTCPFLYQLDTIAYFALIRGVHTHSTIARIRETTQLLLDVYIVREQFYVHPLKVWERYSPTMFFPHLIDGDKAVSITASASAAALFAGMSRSPRPRDYWEDTLEQSLVALDKDAESQAKIKKLLISLIIGKEQRIAELANKYFSLRDILDIASREIGTGFVGGKSVGMLLGRKILETNISQGNWEPHDSYYLGADIFYTYIVQNGWWELRTKQKTAEGYFALAPELREKLMQGKFPDILREQFVQMLEHYGQSPIIVRSSSLLEDNFGNAFAGKYESVFCANQGSPETRFEAFEQAVRTVYASAMSDDALAYRQTRGLAGKDEQMAILVQRVSGDHYGDLFFPHVAGVGNSSNLYVWNKDIDPNAGMLRLVFGLGTRAVDRVSGDYARIVTLDHPEKGPPVNHGDEKKFSQHNADVLNLRENRLTETPLDSLSNCDLKTNRNIFSSVDTVALNRMKELGVQHDGTPQIFDFKGLLTETSFPALASTVLSTLKTAYDYPVDIEFTANFSADGNFRFNLLQCRPLQTKGFGKAVEIPELEQGSVFFSSSKGNFMGGNVRLPLDYVLFVKAKEYLELPDREKYQAARLIGKLNQKLKGNSVMLIGPGRWGTTTPSLGVPVNFSELCNMTALCEVSYRQGGLVPELSFGSHFFQDIVESGIFYAAIFDGDEGVTFHPELVLERKNIFEAILPEDEKWGQVLHLAKTDNLTLYSDITGQKLLCGGFCN